MNIPLLVSAVLSTATVFLHVFGGDKEARELQPAATAPVKQKTVWTMLRGTFHWVTFDLLLATVLQWLLLVSDVIVHKHQALVGLALYFVCAAVFWVINLLVSPKFPRNWLLLGQWLLLLVIAGLLGWSAAGDNS